MTNQSGMKLQSSTTLQSGATFRAGPNAVEKSLALGLLQIKAVDLRPHEPFTWSSGWKSPIYCDNRLILGYPVLRDLVAAEFHAIIQQDFAGVDIIAGAATGGIAHAAIVADRLGMPTAYVRGSAKGHGRQKRVEGRVFDGASAIVIEDTLSTGKSAFEAAAALQEEGVRVLGILSIFSYDFAAAEVKVAESGIPTYRLLDYPTLIDVASTSGYITPTDVAGLLQWRESPETYGV